MGRIVGIDLGTTYCAIGVVDSAGRPGIVLNREGERITPSAVQFVSDSEALVGTQAKQAAAAAPGDVVQFVKRHMGDPSWRYYGADGRDYRAEQISAVILRRLKEDAELALGEPVDRAVITVPAFFGDAHRTATVDAGRIAGLEVVRIINEPTAAALAYGLTGEDKGTILVYDLGGGTFDVTVMRVGDGSFDVVATRGDRSLGGFDWDNALMAHIAAEVRGQGGPDLSGDGSHAAELRAKAEQSKRALTAAATSKVHLTVEGRTYKVAVTRERFEDLTRSLVSTTCDLAAATLEDVGLGWADVDRVLLVGGSTYMPMIGAALRAASGREPDRSVNADEVVALGAAIQARECERGTARDEGSAAGPELTIHDVTSHGIGNLALDQSGRMANSVVVPRNSRVPARASGHYCTVADRQAQIKLDITEGDDRDPEAVEVIGSCTFALPPYPRGAPIRIDIAFDANGRIFAEVFDGTNGAKLGDLDIPRTANLTDLQVAEATAVLEVLEVD
jgi:molecular chaperone DnaK (HSP70)